MGFKLFSNLSHSVIHSLPVFAASLAFLCSLTHSSANCQEDRSTIIECDVQVMVGSYRQQGPGSYLYLCGESEAQQQQGDTGPSQSRIAGLVARLVLPRRYSPPLPNDGLQKEIIPNSRVDIRMCFLTLRLLPAEQFSLETARELCWVVKFIPCVYQSISIRPPLPSSPVFFKGFEKHQKIHLVNSLLCSFLDFNIYLLIQSNIWWMPMGKKIRHYEKQKPLYFFFPSPSSLQAVS